MLTHPVSGMSSVESIRISVDLPEPLAPRIPTISRRLIVRLTLSTARTSRFSLACFLPGKRNTGRDFLKVLVTASITTASMFVSMTISVGNGVFSVKSRIAKFFLLELEQTGHLLCLHIQRTAIFLRRHRTYAQIRSCTTGQSIRDIYHFHALL